MWDADSAPGQRAVIPHASWTKIQNIKQKQYCNKFNEDFINGPHQKINSLKRKEQIGVSWNIPESRKTE